MIERCLVTIPTGERMQIAGDILDHRTDQVIPLLTYYDAQPTIVGKRLQNVAIHIVADSTNTWNAQDWDVAP